MRQTANSSAALGAVLYASVVVRPTLLPTRLTRLTDASAHTLMRCLVALGTAGLHSAYLTSVARQAVLLCRHRSQRLRVNSVKIG